MLNNIGSTKKKSNFGLDIRDLCPQHLVYYSYSRRPHIMQFCEEKDWVQSRPPSSNKYSSNYYGKNSSQLTCQN
jgi:hypothetical protein